MTTVPERRLLTLPRTLQSLVAAGFPEYRLFVDGDRDMSQWPSDVTFRYPRVGPLGNWYLALLELYIRSPACERYAIFQDDLVAVRGLREYLDQCSFPERGYWNLFTFLDNGRVNRPGWQESPISSDDPRSTDQGGRGALGLVFSREGVQLLLSSRSLANKPASVDHPRDKIDGGIVAAMNLVGWREHVHNPSLLLHTGTLTSVQEPEKMGKVWKSNASTFPGEDVDIRTWMLRS